MVEISTHRQPCVANAPITGIFTNGDVVVSTSIDQRLLLWRLGVSCDTAAGPTLSLMASEVFDVADASGLGVCVDADGYGVFVDLR